MTTGTSKTQAALTAEINTNLPDNAVGLITPAILRQTLADMVASTGTLLDSLTYSGFQTFSGGLIAEPLSETTPITISASTYSMGTTDASYIITTSSSLTPVTITLVAASLNSGRSLSVTNNNAVQVVSASSNVVLLGGVAGTTILASVSTKYAQLKSNGTYWYVIAAN